MFLLERFVINRKIEKKTLKLFELRDLCDAYTAAEKGAEELLRKQFAYGRMTTEMLNYVKNEGSLVVKRLFTEVTGKEA